MSGITSATLGNRFVLTDDRYKPEKQQAANREKELADKAVQESSETRGQGPDLNRGRTISNLV